MEIKKGKLFELYKKTNNIPDDYFNDIELKYIKQLCPIVEQRIIDAQSFYSQYKRCKLDVSSLAKELGVTRPTIYKKGIIHFIDFCKGLFPGFYSSEEIKRLTKQVHEKEERLKEFRLKDYNLEELRIKCLSSDAAIQNQKILIKNLEKKVKVLEKENINLRKQFGITIDTLSPPIERKEQIIDFVNGHVKKGTKIEPK